MAELGGVKLTQDTSKQSEKAEALNQIVESIVNKITEIDEEIITLVRGGMEGASVQSMANTYIRNREVINDYVRKFAGIACVLYENAEGMKTLETQSDTAAGGNS